mmetsp:Transcript_20264/g.70163  ORF Transcript_20264/g.70163 Transcript_20264/m.70163 type:complete len:230 (-) Transcript_20264:620-1309(-)
MGRRARRELGLDAGPRLRADAPGQARGAGPPGLLPLHARRGRQPVPERPPGPEPTGGLGGLRGAHPVDAGRVGGRADEPAGRVLQAAPVRRLGRPQRGRARVRVLRALREHDVPQLEEEGPRAVDAGDPRALRALRGALHAEQRLPAARPAPRRRRQDRAPAHHHRPRPLRLRLPPGGGLPALVRPRQEGEARDRRRRGPLGHGGRHRRRPRARHGRAPVRLGSHTPAG